ncbi:MAG: hypothetical protein OHK0024_29930 [Thalassobaculales bacterium]
MGNIAPLPLAVLVTGDGDRAATLAGLSGAAASGLAVTVDGDAAGWHLVLPAGARLPPGWHVVVAAHIADPRNSRRAAAFALRLDDPTPAARRAELLVAVMNRRLGRAVPEQGRLSPGLAATGRMEFFDLELLSPATRWRRGGWLGTVLRDALGR